MKQILLVTTEDTLNQDAGERIHSLAEDYEGRVAGVICCPKMQFIAGIDQLKDMLMKLEPDYVFFTEHDCLFSEIKNDCLLSKQMDKAGIKLIDVLEGEEMRRLINKMPAHIVNALKENDVLITDEIEFEGDEENVLIISDGSANKKELSIFNEAMALGNVNTVANVSFSRYDKAMCNDIRSVIENFDINRIIVFNDIASPEFYQFIGSLEQEGMTVQYREIEQQELKNMNSMSGIKFH